MWRLEVGHHAAIWQCFGALGRVWWARVCQRMVPCEMPLCPSLAFGRLVQGDFELGLTHSVPDHIKTLGEVDKT